MPPGLPHGITSRACSLLPSQSHTPPSTHAPFPSHVASALHIVPPRLHALHSLTISTNIPCPHLLPRMPPSLPPLSLARDSPRRKSASLRLLKVPDGQGPSTPPPWQPAPHRAYACMLSQCQQGDSFAFNAVPSQAHGAMLPMASITTCQLRLRLPLSLLQGITTCVCGAAVDCYGDHCLSCRHFQTHRTPWHNLVEHAAAGMARHARHHVSGVYILLIGRVSLGVAITSVSYTHLTLPTILLV